MVVIRSATASLLFLLYNTPENPSARNKAPRPNIIQFCLSPTPKKTATNSMQKPRIIE